MKPEPQLITSDEARDQVWQAIRTVTDPELDESIADLGFIQSVAITQPGSADPSAAAGVAVHITFRLPTYWCAANFAFMMAEDLRERIVRLPWVRDVNVELVDHFTSDEINRGIAAGASFADSFPTLAESETERANESASCVDQSDTLVEPKAAASTLVERNETSRRVRELRPDRGVGEPRPNQDSARCVNKSDGNLADLRRLFRLKAFQRRQYRLIRYLLDNPPYSSQDRASLLAMTTTQLRDLPITDDEGAKLRTAYLDILPEFAGLPRRRDLLSGIAPLSEASSSPSQDSLAFILPNRSPVDPAHLDDHLRQLRRTTINIEFNSAICTSLLKSRNTPP